MAKKSEPTIKKIVIKKRKLEPMPAGSCPYCGREHEINAVLRENAQKEAYKKAAIATIKKLRVLNREPIFKALHDLERYEEYLIRDNNLSPEDVK